MQINNGDMSNLAKNKGLAAHAKQLILCSIHFDTNTNTIHLKNTSFVNKILNCRAFLEDIHGVHEISYFALGNIILCYTAY